MPDLPIDKRGYDRIDYQDARSLTLGLEKLIEQELPKPDPGMAAEMKLLREKIYRLVEAHPALKKTEIASRLGLEVTDIGSAVDGLLRAGRIERRGKYNNTVFYIQGRAPPGEDAGMRDKLKPEDSSEQSDARPEPTRPET
jgi:predicted HTH transcriptional regulator